jgi:hypothetical protein
MSGKDSISTEAVIKSRAHQAEAQAEAVMAGAKTHQGPTSNQELISRAKADGQQVFGVQLHKSMNLPTGNGPGSDLQNELFTLKMGGPRDSGKVRIYELGEEIIIWHEQAMCSRRVQKSNVAVIYPMGSEL